MGHKSSKEIFILKGYLRENALDFMLHMEIIDKDEFHEYKNCSEDSRYENFQSLFVKRVEMFNHNNKLNWFVNIDQNDILGIFIKSYITEVDSEISDLYLPEIEDTSFIMPIELEKKFKEFVKTHQLKNIFYIA